MESASNDVTKLDQQHAVNYHKQLKSKKYQNNVGNRIPPTKDNGKATTSNANGKKDMVCYCCGTKGHTKPFCKYKSYSCSNCSKLGHLKKVCKAKVKKVNNLEQCDVDLNLDNLFNLETVNVNYVQPYWVKLSVEDKIVEFQIDTGSSMTVINVNDLKNYEIKYLNRVEQSNVRLKTYNNSVIVPLGVLKVRVQYKDVCKELEMVVVKEGGPPILGREWLTKLSIPMFSGTYSLCKLISYQNVVQTFPSVFNDILGCYKHKMFDLILKKDFKPVFLKPRVLPFALKGKVSDEIDRLVNTNLLVPVETSDWGTPIVPVKKSDGTIRLCGDYKVTLNKYLEIDRYPIPRVADLMIVFQGAAKFCSLDLCQAYQQLVLSEESKKLTTISTFKGLFMFNRLPYGIASAPGLLQREMEKLLSAIPGTVCFYDDIVIAGKDDKELSERLYSVLDKLSLAGLTVKKEKCNFFTDHVTFLGYKVDKNGLHIPDERIKAINNVAIPKSTQDVKAFLGLVNYYGKFVENMSTIAGPLYALLKNNTQFVWNAIQSKAFSKIKESILSNKVLVHYNPNLELIVASDASPFGVGAVLSHIMPDGSEKPIAFASRTLSASEKNYAQIDKEALALVFAIKYFHQFVYGREFILRTDHKPLVSIFGEKKGIPLMSAHRLQRYAIFLSSYTYKIEFIKGLENGNADALSRLPLSVIGSNDIECDNFFINMVTTNIKSIGDLDICNEIKKDVVLRDVFIKVFTGNWPDNSKDVSLVLKPFYSRRLELSIEQGCLMWGHRLIIPPKYRKQLLQELHSTHMGTVKMKALARSYLWWPGMDSEIECITKECKECLILSDSPPKSVLHNWPWPEGPAQRIHVDFLGPVKGMMFIVILDAYSKWVFVKRMLNITSSSTVMVLREYFATWGIPAKLVSDNGPSLCSVEFETFLKNNGVFHIKTAPYNPSSNGAAENLVRTFKNYLKKVISSTNNKDCIDTSVLKFILSYNSTKHCSTGFSPAQLHIGRSLFTSYDRLTPFAKVNYEKSLDKNKNWYRGNRNKEYIVGDLVMCRNYTGGDEWVQAVILQKLSPVTYDLRLGDGRIWKRHVNQIIDCGLVVEKEVSTDQNINLEQEEVIEEKLEVTEELGKDVFDSQKDTCVSTERPKRVKRSPNKLNL
ncbi:unnamed protein product [Macrosiphum euphorbiae]|uniref:RNA-directed DNA polymerase n=1 Tax=Macrosiphum euphorbiae TaxID=13131 RepID=A0AAV0VYT5_9HEMI|nr:unnamed protein product [Macrosiphum euphorbiae]